MVYQWYRRRVYLEQLRASWPKPKTRLCQSEINSSLRKQKKTTSDVHIFFARHPASNTFHFGFYAMRDRSIAEGAHAEMMCVAHHHSQLYHHQ